MKYLSTLKTRVINMIDDFIIPKRTLRIDTWNEVFISVEHVDGCYTHRILPSGLTVDTTIDIIKADYINTGIGDGIYTSYDDAFTALENRKLVLSGSVTVHEEQFT